MIGEEAFEHKAAAEKCGINKSRMETKAIIPAVLTRALTVAYLEEKQMNLSPSFFSAAAHRVRCIPLPRQRRRLNICSYTGWIDKYSFRSKSKEQLNERRAGLSRVAWTCLIWSFPWVACTCQSRHNSSDFGRNSSDYWFNIFLQLCQIIGR